MKSFFNREERFPILVVEDNPVDRRIIRDKLVREGYSVVTANDGIEALAEMESFYFPIVITDWLMPKMDGIELCRNIRARDFPGYVSIIFVTTKTGQDDMLCALEAGADDFLSKPFNQAELIARLRNTTRHLSMDRDLQNAYAEIKLLSSLDPLTKLTNRACLFDSLTTEILRAKRYNNPLSLIMCDIDHFKNVNDRHGHLAGDKVLITFAEFLKKRTRISIDIVARYGGEEFLLMLPETGPTGAKQLASRLCQDLARQEIPLHDGMVSITASFGVSGFKGFNGINLAVESFIDKADRQLYKAKNSGRNRVCVESVDPKNQTNP